MIDKMEWDPNGRTCRIYSADQLIATLTKSCAAQLQLEPGRILSINLRARIAQAEQICAAMEKALKLLGASSKSQAQVRERLIASGIPEDIANHAIDKLAAMRAFDDQAAAQSMADRLAGSGESNESIRIRLESKGFKPPKLEIAGDESQRALQFAQQAADRMPPTMAYEVKWRRLFGALARKGYDEQLCADTVGRILGEPPEPTHEP
ncbi:MAG: regulatory protein RecX [Phycisphaerales bacterium]|jgi:SOS response regulatory protein OraA/RecX